MHVQILTFPGPRGDAMLAASRRAGRERIAPLVSAHPQLKADLYGGFRAVGPDGQEVVVTLAANADALDTLTQVVMTSELLPGEDPALLPGPSGVERYVVDDVYGPLSRALKETNP